MGSQTGGPRGAATGQGQSSRTHHETVLPVRAIAPGLDSPPHSASLSPIAARCRSPHRSLRVLFHAARPEAPNSRGAPERRSAHSTRRKRLQAAPDAVRTAPQQRPLLLLPSARITLAGAVRRSAVRWLASCLVPLRQCLGCSPRSSCREI